MTLRAPLVRNSTTGKIEELGSGDTIGGAAAGANGTNGTNGATINGLCNGRLTLTTGVPVTTTDVTGATTIYFTPYRGAQIGLYDGAAWSVISFAETSLALGTLTSGKNYDVFAYNNSGTLALELSAAWTNDTTRANALALQDGIYVKSGTATRRYLGTFRTTSTTATEDSAAKRFVWNAYNQVRRSMLNATETTDSWTYSTAAYRQSNANAANQLDYVVGDAAAFVEARARSIVNGSANNQGATSGIGVDSTTTNSSQLHGGNVFASIVCVLDAIYSGYPGLGRHTLVWLENGNGGGTQTWYGDAGAPTFYQSGIMGTLWN